MRHEIPRSSTAEHPPQRQQQQQQQGSESGAHEENEREEKDEEERQPPQAKIPRGETRRKRRGGSDKARLLRLQAALRAQTERTVLAWQERLFYGAVDPAVLLEASRYFQPAHLQEVVMERNCSNVCGYPLCDRQCQEIKGRYRISLRENRIYDATEERSFCGKGCKVGVRYLSSQLSEEAVYSRNFSTLPMPDLLPPRLTAEEIRARLRRRTRVPPCDSGLYQCRPHVLTPLSQTAAVDVRDGSSPTSAHALRVVERSAPLPPTAPLAVATEGRLEVCGIIEGYRVPDAACSG